MKIRATGDPIGVAAKTPAFLGFLHVATKRIGHNLVAKADAEHGRFRFVGGADKIPQRRQPVVIFIDPGGRTSQHDALQTGWIG
jgi:hypothetical protein